MVIIIVEVVAKVFTDIMLITDLRIEQAGLLRGGVGDGRREVVGLVAEDQRAGSELVLVGQPRPGSTPWAAFD